MEFLDYLDEEIKHTYNTDDSNSKFKIKDIFNDHWYSFLQDNPNLNIRPVVYSEVEKMMGCGSLSNGYAVYSCDNCNNFLYVPFTCKSRFCSSCGTKYTLDRADTISAKCISCPHRHITFTINSKLWPLFQHDRSLLNLLFDAVSSTILSWFYDQNHKENFTPGFISTLHTFGRDLKWNPHIHVLLAEIKLGEDNSCKKWDYFDFDALSKRFQKILLDLLSKKLGKDFPVSLKKELFQKYKSGFYVYAEKKKFKSLKEGIEYVTRYCGRAPISENRIKSYDGKNVTFWYNAHEDESYHEVTVSAQKFIFMILRHIIPSQFKIIRYNGFYRKKHPLHSTMNMLIDKAKRFIRKQFLKHENLVELSFGRNPYKCPHCNIRMMYVLEIT